MSFQLQLHFTGLCAFVPKLDITKPNNRAQVLFRTVAKGGKYDEHIAACVCRASDSLTTARKVKTYFDPLRHEKQYCILKREGIELQQGDGTPLPDPALTFSGSAVPSADFAWVAPLYETDPDIPDAGVVKSGDLWIPKKGQVPPASDVNVAVTLTAGTLSTSRVWRWSLNQDPAACTFEPNSKPPRYDSIAEEVVLTYDFKDAVKLVSTPWDGGTGDPIVLAPKKPKTYLEVWMKNLAKDDVEENDLPGDPEDDNDFEEFYYLSKTDPGPNKRPFPRPVPLPDPLPVPVMGFRHRLARFLGPGKPPHLTNPFCPPAQFMANQDV